MKRRDFLRALAGGGTLAAMPAALRVLLEFEEAHAGTTEVRPLGHWASLSGGRTQCFVCPLHCVLEDGETCFCRTRQNRGGRLVTNAYGNPCIVRKDPIEKTPLNHVFPGTSVLSIATGGCNLRCLYCQNWKESQAFPEDLPSVDVPPPKAVESAKAQSIDTLCFTYTEPVSYLEYARDMAAYGREHGVRSVVATAAFVEREPLRELCRVTDAFVVSLKGFDDAFYEKVVGQPMFPVLDALETIRSEGTWLEILTLLVPTLNDDMAKIRERCRWIRKTLGADVPLHFARFVPEYRLKDLPRTPIPTLEEARQVALDAGLRFVYLSNVAPHEGNRTLCPRCKTVLVDRVGFRVLSSALDRGACPACRTKIPGRWA